MVAKKTVLKPASTLVKKRSFLVPVLLLAVILLAAAVIFWTKTSLSSSPIVAAVNGEPVYQSSIDEEYNRLPPEYQAQYTKDYILNQTIDKRLLLQEAKKRGLTVSEEEVNEQVKTIISQFGLAEADLEKILAGQNMTLEQYKEVVKEEMLLNKVVQDAVTSRVQLSEQELVEYYDAHQEEFTAPAGGVIVSHILVANEDEAKAVIAKLGAGESFESLAEQYSLDNGSKTQGGYLGIVTNETPFVAEFKTASLKLRQQQYTRTPVQSTYGYHVIKRLADSEPYKYVRSRIEKQLKIQKQIALFQAFLADLRAKSVVKYYTSQGTVTSQPAQGSLASFSQCVAGKATLYGTGWSDFSEEQRQIFGDSFSYLTYVDCDDKPHLCSAANVQKYPTWVIAGTDEHLGRLSLQELSEKTGCELPN